MKTNMFSFTFLCKVSCICSFSIFVPILIKFSPKYRAKYLGMIFKILGSFCSVFNWKGANIWPQIRPRKIPVIHVWYTDFFSFQGFLVNWEIEKQVWDYMFGKDVLKVSQRSR